MKVFNLSQVNLLEVAKGNVPGMKSYSIPGRKDGLSSSVLDDLSEVPSTTVVQEPGGIQLEVVSSDANDTILGTGTRSIEMYYLDSNGLEQQEIVELNGTTPVNTVATDIDYVQWFHTQTVGSGGVADGNLSIRSVGGATTYEYITSGGNQSLAAKFKIPSDKIGYVIGWQASGFTQKIDMRLRATVDRFGRTLLPGIFLFQDIAVLKDSTSGWIPFNIPLKMPSNSVVKMSGISSLAGGDGAGQFDILLIDK